jgi:uncharacterized protein YgbK (DUF1537 family)
MKKAGATVVHYKICSTFDSSPELGSIGKAMEIGRDLFGGRYVPLLVGVPYLRRYTLFGNHFAAAGELIHRLDRHPTMSQHPVTPMVEADLRKHLHKQTKMQTSLFDIIALEGSDKEVHGKLEQLIETEQPEVMLFDVLDESRLEKAGRLIWQEANDGEGLFVVGSSGVEYALNACWKADGILPPAEQEVVAVESVDRLLVVSGSCSPVTEKQIQRALEAGFIGIRVPMNELIQPELAQEAQLRLQQEVRSALENGQSVVLYTASGPQDQTIALIRETLVAQGLKAEDSGRLLGQALGKLTRELVAETGLSRILIAGGDTSGYITRELGIYALACKAALEPGGPLCRAYSTEPQFDGLELVLKGGQVGGENFFDKVRVGTKL